MMTSPQIRSIVLPTKSTLKSYRFYIVENKGKVFLVDAGVDSKACWGKFQGQLSLMNLEVRDLDAIILTHHHADHIGLVNRIKEMHDVPVFAHPKAFHRLRRDEDFLQKRIDFFEHLYTSMGCGKEAEAQINRLRDSLIQNKSQAIKGDIYPIKEGDNFYGFSILNVPGHAVDHIVLVDETSGILFSGDMIIEHISTNALIDRGEDGERARSLQEYEQSLLKLKELHLQVIYPGHGEVICNPQEVMNKKINRMKQKGERVRSYITGQHTAAEIAQKMYRSRYETLFPLVMSEVIGHLDRLVSLNRLKVIKRENILYFERG